MVVWRLAVHLVATANKRSVTSSYKTLRVVGGKLTDIMPFEQIVPAGTAIMTTWLLASQVPICFESGEQMVLPGDVHPVLDPPAEPPAGADDAGAVDPLPPWGDAPLEGEAEPACWGGEAPACGDDCPALPLDPACAAPAGEEPDDEPAVPDEPALGLAS